MELKPSDTKLLAYLYHNHREPFTEIARATHLTREQVDYKIKKYIEEGLIKQFVPIFNYSKFGYSQFILLMIKFENQEKLEKFKTQYKKDKHLISLGEMFAKYDLYIQLIFQNNKEKNEYLFDLLQKEIHGIVDYLIIEPYYNEMYPLKFLGSKVGDSYLMIDYPKKEIKLDENDKRILKILSNDGRARIIDIAKETNISAELIIYKLKRLRKEGLILGSKINFDMKKFGYFYTLLAIQFKDFSIKEQDKIKTLAKNYSHINSLTLVTSKPNCFIQVFHKNEEELRDIINKIKKSFVEQSVDIEIIPLEQEDYVNVLPFL